MAEPQTAVLNAIDTHGRGLCVQFFRYEDRYAHSVAAVANGRSATLLESIEGSSDEAWPESPALQALNVEQVAQHGGPAALIGMSGSSHWSVTVERQFADERPRLVFDVACRASAPPPFLSSCYKIADEVDVDCFKLDERGSRRHRANLHLGEQVYSLVAQPVADHDECVVTASATVMQCAIQLETDGASRPKRTHRWRYAIEAHTDQW